MTQTDASAALLAVTQADREAAANEVHRLGHPYYAPVIARGDDDGHWLVQFAARHRLSATRADERPVEVERLREALKPFVAHWQSWMGDTFEHPDYDEMSCFARVTYGDLRCARAALAHPPAAGGETFDTIREWAERTFGEVTAQRCADRAAEELAEMREEAAQGWTEKAITEAADVLIVLSRAPGLWAAVERKMVVNRARQWSLRGDGTGYHVAAPDPSTPGEVGDVEQLRTVIHNDAILFGKIETRMRECWVGTGRLSEDGTASNDFRVWMNEAHNRQRDLKAALGQNPNVPLAPRDQAGAEFELHSVLSALLPLTPPESQ